MAIYNEILSARFARMIQKLFSMKGPAPVRQLAGELMPVLPVFIGAENRYLEGWERFGVWQQQGAVAAQNTGFQVRNPAGSGVVAVFEKIACIPSIADQPQLARAVVSTDFTTVDTFTFGRFDARGRPSTNLVLSRGNNVGVGTFHAQVGVAAQTTGEFIVTDIQEIPLLPGDALRLTSVAVNLTLSAIWWWRERPLEESEKA